MWGWVDWVSTCGSSMFWRRFHGIMSVLWILNIPLAIITGLKSSIAYLIFCIIDDRVLRRNGSITWRNGTREPRRRHVWRLFLGDDR